MWFANIQLWEKLNNSNSIISNSLFILISSFLRVVLLMCPKIYVYICMHLWIYILKLNLVKKNTPGASNFNWSDADDTSQAKFVNEFYHISIILLSLYSYYYKTYRQFYWL